MEVFIKSFADYRTVKKAVATSYTLVLDALDPEASTITVAGTEISNADVGSWMVCDGQVYRISSVKQKDGQTTVALESPLQAFQRPLIVDSQKFLPTIGGFIESALQRNWAACDDPAYAMPYLVGGNSEETPFVKPTPDDAGSFSLSDYVRLMRKTYRTTIRFEDHHQYLAFGIFTAPEDSRQVSFEDGHSQLGSVTYTNSGLAKITAVQDIDTGELNDDGTSIIVKEETTWYLSENGEISQLVPDSRAIGDWGMVHVKRGERVAEKVAEAFAKNQKSHKLEFWSNIDLPVQANCTFLVYGQLLRSHISYKRKSSTDNRFYYKSGELATTATEKLKGALK